MIAVPEIVLERIAVATKPGGDFPQLARAAVTALGTDDFGGVIAATFSSPNRFPAVAVEAASWMRLPASTPAFDLQLACSAYPYALYLAGKLAADTGRKILVVDGDVQTPLVDAADPATGAIFADAVTATVVAVNPAGESTFDFMSRYDSALSCAATGPIRMDGFKVFTYVATEVAPFLKTFGTGFDRFVPHQAQPYMIRQLAAELGLESRLLTLPPEWKNPGSCSVAAVLALNASQLRGARVLVAGFGAGFSASAGVVRLGAGFTGVKI